ncbi:MAG: hypothetical protein A2X84_12150 [Desulfuromonadaceae bacterium GWC2_58_13]|nr:MAG: hypothetical protein A2X84_12150 [Desulfuromonadaceae bacterium GWC2_58_13]
MWLLMKRLLTLTALVLTTSVSAQAALTFGAAPAVDSLIQSVPQAQRFGAYLEKHLGEPVDVRIFATDHDLRETLNAYYDVDLAVIRGNRLRHQPNNDFKELANSARKTGPIAKADMLVMRQGLDSELLSRIRTVLADMEKDPEGHALLYNLGIQRFALAGDIKPVSPAPVGPRLNPPRPSPAQRPTVPVVRPPEEFTLGVVADPGAPLRSKEAAEDFAKKLGQQLKSPVKVRVFKEETVLHDWLNRYRMVELALFSSGYLQKHPEGEFELLAQPADLANQGLTADASLVARQGFDPARLTRLSSSLEQIKGAPLVPLPSRSSLPVATAVSAPTTTPEVIRHTQPTQLPKPMPRVGPTGETATRLALGAVPTADAPFRSEAQVQAFGRLLENRLGAPVDTRTFKDQASLREWLNRYRMVDVGLFDEIYLQKQSPSEFKPLLPVSDLGGPAGSRLVGRQGLDEALLTRVRNALQQMKNDPEVATLFHPAASITPVAAGAPIPAPIIKPAVPTATPKVEIPPAPAIPEPKPEPVAPAIPPVEVEKMPESPTTTRISQPEIPVAPKPEPPEVVVRSSVKREQVYLAPFITVMVPGALAEKIFDTFVDQLNADGMNQQYEFVILKGGLDSVDPAWLADRNYVTGEIFGYVEESGCCSTDIRTKSRIVLYRKGSAIPALKYEYPVKIFFDHDYSTIEKERQNIAGNIAGELATKVRSALSGS